MKSISNNPYRIAGILSNSSAREVQSRKSKVTKFASIGKEITSEYDFSFFSPIERNSSIIEKAFSDIEQNQNKVIHSLFWFINLNTIDNTAINYMIEGQRFKAVEIWKKMTDDKEVTSKNFSAFNNIGTLYLLEDSKEKIKQGIATKIKLIESESFKDFVHTVADETFSIDKTKQTEIFIDELLLHLKSKFSTGETLDLFKDCSTSTQTYISKKYTEAPIQNIETRIEQIKNKRSNNKIASFRFATELYDNTKSDLSFLKSTLGTSNFQYQRLVDGVAKEILQCSIDYFNESQEQDRSNDYLEEAMKLAKLAESIAVNATTKNKARENISTLEEMKDRELSEVIMLLKSIRETYKENERKIRNEVTRMQETDIQLRMGYRTINWTAVEENIKSSINWVNVNNLLSEILPQIILQKIKKSDKVQLKEEFWELLNWAKEHSLLNSPILNIIEKYKNIAPQLFFEVLSAEISNTDSKSKIIEKPFFTEDIRYVSIKLNVRSTGTQKVKIYKKYVNPENRYSNGNTSPKGYTSVNEVTISPESKTVDLGGYGNATKCSYMTGEHKIEIYVEHYKIFTKTFKVDWSPSKKNELTRNLNLLQNELREVEKFQWFRSSETKQKEVKAVKDKINKANQTLMNK